MIDPMSVSVSLVCVSCVCRFLDWELGCLRDENDALLTELATLRGPRQDDDTLTELYNLEEDGGQEDAFLMLTEEEEEEEEDEEEGEVQGEGLDRSGQTEDDELRRITEGMAGATADKEVEAAGAGRIGSRAF